MKIVFANDTIYGYATGAAVVGGAERQQWLLARTLADTGWSVTVGVREGLAAGERRTIGAVNFVGIGRAPVHAAWYRFLADEHPQWWYWRCASHLWGVAVEIAKITGVRTIFAAGVDSDVQSSRALFRRSRLWPLYAWGLSRTDRIFVQHSGQLSALARQWQSKASIVPSIAGELPTVIPHPQRAGHVAWVGMLRQPKRPDLLIEIARAKPDLRFVVCGGPTDFASPSGYGEQIVASLRAQPNIEFLGKVAPEQATQVIADAAVLLSTSDAEGFPNTFLEAWSRGTPVVSLRLDPDRIIERCGLGTVPGDCVRAVADISSLMDSPQRRDEIGARARQYVEQAHSEATVAAIFERAVS